MARLAVIAALIAFPLFISPAAEAVDIQNVFSAVQSEISGNRARDYVMRLWMCDKWSTLPAWKRSAREAQAIMKERGFDEAVIEGTPADGKTMSGAWTNPVGWDAKSATLEVIEPNVPDEFRYLCNYQDNPTSLNCWSAPTPPGGIETELALWEGSDPADLAKLNARGKIVLTGNGTRAYKRYLDPNGILGFVGDMIEGENVDFINANQWLNGWTDLPGGWWLTSFDSHKNFGFSISQKKANYLRTLLRNGTKVRVRAKIDSRIYTDDTLDYVVGQLKGTGQEEVFVNGHLSEWGANDNASGCAAVLEAVGVLHDLIQSGQLPRPKRSIRIQFGAELYGSLPYVQKHLDRFGKTVAALCCDTPVADYDAVTTVCGVALSPNVCPSFTDELLPEIARMYYARYAPTRMVRTEPFNMGTDTYFCDPLIGVPTNYITMDNGGHLHHNSMDTIEKVDTRTLRELAFLNAVYLYYLANAGFEDLPWIAGLTFSHGIGVIRDKALQANAKIAAANDGPTLGAALADGTERIDYYTGLLKQALTSMERLVPADHKTKVRELATPYAQSFDDFAVSLTKQLQALAESKAKAQSIQMVMPQKQDSAWDKEASTLIPKRHHFATLFLREIPVSEWKEIKSSPHWWEADNPASASFWWVDGKRNLKEIKRLCELESGKPITGFDLINYYKFLEKFKYVEFVK